MAFFWDSAWARRIENKLDLLLGITSRQGAQEMAKIDDLLESTAELTTVAASAENLLTQLHDMLVDAQASGDPAKLQQAIDAIEANKSDLAAAVAANTPGA